MSVFGEIAKSVGEEVAKGLEKNVAPVVKKAAKNVVDTVEGWGFKSKPGEISGNRAIDALYSHNHYGLSAGGSKAKQAQAKKDWEQFTKQVDNAVEKGKIPMDESYGPYYSGYQDIATTLYQLEDLGIPREHTGEILRLVPKLKKSLSLSYNDLAYDMKKLSSKDERSLYLSMLPQWDGTRQSLVKFVKADTAQQAKDTAREIARKSL